MCGLDWVGFVCLVLWHRPRRWGEDMGMGLEMEMEKEKGQGQTTRRTNSLKHMLTPVPKIWLGGASTQNAVVCPLRKSTLPTGCRAKKKG